MPMIHPDEIRWRVERFPALCRQAGLKVTPQRSAVYAMLAATDTHPTPDAIYASIHQTLPSLSLATVYKILDQFTARGLLIKLATPDQAARYDARIDPHQHGVCSACGRIEDLELEPLNRALSGVAQPNGFQVRRVEVVLHGLCGECSARGTA
jgi:Fur family peroxide stress response transcriptional regulator